MNPNSAAGPGLFVARSRSANALPTLMAAMAGALQAASLAFPFSLPDVFGLLGWVRGQPVWWLQCLSMAWLVHLLLQAKSPRQAAWRGWFFALAWLSLTFAWLFISMHTYGGLPALLAVLAVLALAGALAIYYAAISWCFKALAQVGQAQTAIVFAALWTLAELARGQWLTGFGWGASAYAQIDGPFAHLIAWLGLYGIGFAAALLAGLVVQMVGAATLRDKLTAAVAMAVLLLGAAMLPAASGESSGSLRVTLLQGNIAQEEKFQASTGVPHALRWYGDQLQANRSDLIITPETALAVLPQQLPDGYWAALQQRFASGQQAALVGVPMGNYADGYTNSVAGFKPGQTEPWRYDKHHLVPFGEFIPPLARWFTNLMAIPLGDFNRGGLAQPTFDWQGQRLGATICYENLFSEELAAQFVDPKRAPTILVNISNLGWFGEHLAMDQHLQIARMRALEFDRPFLLATNTGQTGIVNHLGQVTHLATAHQAIAISGEVVGRTGITPYAWWVSRWGQWPMWLFAMAVVLVAFYRTKRS